ncbi:MAG: hypothetical protein POG74_06810 [Acidocella sp.]|nr:hypothetical protein [Acidocella sp.]
MKGSIKRLRFLLQLAALALSACSGDSSPPVTYTPLNYSYLPPIDLKVVSVNIQNNYVPDTGAQALLAQDPETPADAMLAVARQRLVPNGTPGTATFTIENASIEPENGNLVGMLTVRLDVVSADGRAKGYTEASVTHGETAPDSNDQGKMQAALYDITKHLMDGMNVELQYQMQHNLGSWIAYSNNAAAAPVTSNGGVPGGIVATPLAGPLTGQPSGTSTAPMMVPVTPVGPNGLAPGEHNMVPPSMNH